MKKIIAGISCVLFINLFASAQSLYSFEGLGSINHQGMPNNFAMGEVGIGAPTRWHINTMNPANLVYNTFSTFQLGIEMDKRNFSGEGVSGSDTEGGLRYMGYAFPIMKGKWSSSFGILPYSSVNYNTFTESDVANAPNMGFQRVDRRGEGGITNFYWANGFRINSRLSLGVKASFTFGSIDDTRVIQIFERREVVVDTLGNTELADFTVGVPSVIDLQRAYKDLNLQFGASYRHKLTDDKFIDFGLIYSPRSDLNEDITLEDSTVTSFEGNRALPSSIGFGMSYSKLSTYSIGFDIENQMWSKTERGTDSFNNLSRISVGARWIPDFDNVNSYFSRIEYSLGFNRTKIPYIVNNQTLTEIGINFGASLPVGRYSSLDFGFKWGQLGESGNGLIRENYYKIVIGATINDSWFIKRKYD